MRQLKFRAWDNVQNKYVCVGFNIIGEITMFDVLNQYRLEDFNRIEVEQYTGIEDKLGQEIYEGDILQWVSCNPFSLGDIRKVTVMWGHGIWWCKGKEIQIALRELTTKEKVEIIGNIKQNKDGL